MAIRYKLRLKVTHSQSLVRFHTTSYHVGLLKYVAYICLPSLLYMMVSIEAYLASWQLIDLVIV
ncbi:Uncharacterised protein [Salmonella enterica subsp. arizonae]|nr:Uncharacterised protein [Salmonella enterica subsp. arizonae]